MRFNLYMLSLSCTLAYHCKAKNGTPTLQILQRQSILLIHSICKGLDPSILRDVIEVGTGRGQSLPRPAQTLPDYEWLYTCLRVGSIYRVCCWHDVEVKVATSTTSCACLPEQKRSNFLLDDSYPIEHPYFQFFLTFFFSWKNSLAQKTRPNIFLLVYDDYYQNLLYFRNK